MSTPSSTTNPNDAPLPGRIADLSYRNYDGELRTHAVRWWVIALATIRATINKGRAGYWIPAALILLVFVWRAIAFYLMKNIRENSGSMAAAMMPTEVSPYGSEMFGALKAIGIMVFAAVLTIGSASIAADNRANALLVYLSKPLTRTDYMIGKWMGVFLPLAALSVVPSLLMYLFFLILFGSEGFLKENSMLIFKILAAALLLPAIHTSLIIGISAYSRSARMTGAIYAAFYFITATLANVVGGIVWFQDKKGEKAQTTALVQHLHVDGISQGIDMTLFDVSPKDFMPQFEGGKRKGRRDREIELPDKLPERPPIVPMAAIALGLIVLPVAAAYRKVRAVEVISG